MLMPIVSMNKMAMNESVAATCCYREQISATNVYWEVMNGGWLGAGYVKTKIFNGNLSEDEFNLWTKVFPGFDLSGPVAGLPPITDVGYVPDSAGKYHYEIDWNGTRELADAWIYTNGVITKGQSCDHKDATCNYFDYDAVWTENQHWESTSKHDTKTSDWKEPHNAKQWSS